MVLLFISCITSPWYQIFSAILYGEYVKYFGSSIFDIPYTTVTFFLAYAMETSNYEWNCPRTSWIDTTVIFVLTINNLRVHGAFHPLVFFSHFFWFSFFNFFFKSHFYTLLCIYLLMKFLYSQLLLSNNLPYRADVIKMVSFPRGPTISRSIVFSAIYVLLQSKPWFETDWPKFLTVASNWGRTWGQCILCWWRLEGITLIIFPGFLHTILFSSYSSFEVRGSYCAHH